MGAKAEFAEHPHFRLRYVTVREFCSTSSKKPSIMLCNETRSRRSTSNSPVAPDLWRQISFGAAMKLVQPHSIGSPPRTGSGAISALVSPPQNCSMVASNNLASTGLVIRRSIPAFLHFCSVSEVASAVTPMIGRCWRPPSICRHIEHASMPLRRGMLTSSNRISTPPCSSASKRFVAVSHHGDIMPCGFQNSGQDIAVGPVVIRNQHSPRP